MNINVAFSETNNLVTFELSQNNSEINANVNTASMTINVAFSETEAQIDTEFNQGNNDIDVDFGDVIYIPVRESGNITTLGPIQPNLPITGDIWYDTN